MPKFYSPHDFEATNIGVIHDLTNNTTLEFGHDVTRPFLWSDDEKKLIVIDFLNKETWLLILIDLSAGIKNPRIFHRKIDIKSFIKWDIMEEITKKDLSGSAYLCSVETIKWQGPNQIIVKLYQKY